MDNVKSGKVFNDCVHGHMELPPLCIAIIDTHIFQRLRNLKQLGFGYFVYPGASHNRFEHSLGVCHLAGVLVDSLNGQGNSDPKARVSPEEKLCLQVAGLCHDLGHGPFSHVWENVLKRAGVKWKHEEMSIKMLEEIFKIEKIQKEFTDSGLEEKHKELIKDFIGGEERDKRGEERGKRGKERAFLYEIISNKDTGIDVDKWDYLLRDGKQLNINVTFDPHRLLKCQRISKVNSNNDGQEQYRICYRDKDQGNIWHMYMMRAELHRMAYQHPVVKIIEEMFIDAILLIKESYTLHGKKLTEIQDHPKIFQFLSDDIFQEIVRGDKIDQMSRDIQHNYKDAKRLLHRILDRDLYQITEKVTLSSDKEKAEEEMKCIKENLTMQETHGPHLDLHMTPIQWNMQDLKNNVFIYTKYDLNAKVTKDWSSVPFYKDQINQTIVILFRK